MTPKDEAAYRIRIAETRVAEADRLLETALWAGATLLARAAIENAAKGVLACFQAVPRTHEPADVLDASLRDAAFPAELAPRAHALVPTLRGYGMKRHLELAYGDEQNLRTPDELVGEGDALRAVADARTLRSLAGDVRRTVLGA